MTQIAPETKCAVFLKHNTHEAAFYSEHGAQFKVLEVDPSHEVAVLESCKTGLKIKVLTDPDKDKNFRIETLH